jgi:hypothetical protein
VLCIEHFPPPIMTTTLSYLHYLILAQYNKLCLHKVRQDENLRLRSPPSCNARTWSGVVAHIIMYACCRSSTNGQAIVRDLSLRISSCYRWTFAFHFLFLILPLLFYFSLILLFLFVDFFSTSLKSSFGRSVDWSSKQHF